MSNNEWGHAPQSVSMEAVTQRGNHTVTQQAELDSSSSPSPELLAYPQTSLHTTFSLELGSLVLVLVCATALAPHFRHFTMLAQVKEASALLPNSLILSNPSKF